MRVYPDTSFLLRLLTEESTVPLQNIGCRRMADFVPQIRLAPCRAAYRRAFP